MLPIYMYTVIQFLPYGYASVRIYHFWLNQIKLVQPVSDFLAKFYFDVIFLDGIMQQWLPLEQESLACHHCLLLSLHGWCWFNGYHFYHMCEW